MLSCAFYWLLNMSISAAIVGIVVLLIGKIKKLPRRMTHILWAIPFIRMWLPVVMTGKYSLMSLISKVTTRSVVVYKGVFQYTFLNHVMEADNYFPVTYKVSKLDSLFNIVSILWITVALAFFMFVIFIYIRSAYEMKDAVHVRDNVYVSDRISFPATYGIINPKIIIPEEYGERDLQYIIAHENAHIRRLDNLWRLIAVISVCVHWFNPFAWLFLKKFLEETELACDEYVMAKFNEADKKAYAIALVDYAAGTSVFASAFGGAKIRPRIERILTYNRLSVFSVICFTVLVIAIGYLLLTNAY